MCFLPNLDPCEFGDIRVSPQTSIFSGLQKKSKAAKQKQSKAQRSWTNGRKHENRLCQRPSPDSVNQTRKNLKKKERKKIETENNFENERSTRPILHAYRLLQKLLAKDLKDFFLSALRNSKEGLSVISHSQLNMTAGKLPG